MSLNFTDADVPDQSGRTIFVTGANSGLGLEASKVLAARGARVLLGCRSESKALEAIGAIFAQTPSADVDFIPIDLGDLASIRKAAKRVRKKEDRLDVLINNAGLMFPPRQLTADGFESQFGVNHLGTFALTSLLLAKLGEKKRSRVVITSSIAHRTGRIIYGDINAERIYNTTTRYSMSKLANLLHMYELDRRLRAQGSKTIAVACHPGVASTALTRYLPRSAQAAMRMASPMMNTAAEGAWATLAAATHPGAKGGDFYGPKNLFGVSGKAGKASSRPVARSERQGAKLWDLSVEMTGIDPGI